jgi:uncharacterized protein YndB with AHSA1/START domain
MTTNPQNVPGTLVVERLFPHPPQKLWRALTESPLLAQWLMKNDFESTVGRKFQFRSDPVPGWDGLIHCEVLIVEPFKQLSYTWSSMGADFVVLFTLTPAEGATHLRMDQSGFRPEHQAAYKGATYGWQHFFANLYQLLAAQGQSLSGGAA